VNAITTTGRLLSTDVEVDLEEAAVPRGAQPGDGRMRSAISAASEKRHRLMVEMLATGFRRCGRCRQQLPR